MGLFLGFFLRRLAALCMGLFLGFFLRRQPAKVARLHRVISTPCVAIPVALAVERQTSSFTLPLKAGQSHMLHCLSVVVARLDRATQ
jgi:hypothetical protein